MAKTSHEVNHRRTKGPVMPEHVDQRISFHPDLDIFEADFSDLTLTAPDEVERFYDRIEARIAETGQEKWLFLVNYRNCRIMPEAWLAHSMRGKRLNLTHSLGTVRFDASPETSAQIARSANTENFDANLFDNRDAALARLAEMRADIPRWAYRRRPAPSRYPEAEFAARVQFLFERQIMDVDFSHFSFDTNADVNSFYDHIEKRIAETGVPKWYFLVNYQDCVIDMRAWISFSQRGKRLNIAHSLGSVRYGTSAATEAEIRSQAGRQNFQPNIRVTRDEALARIEEMRAEGVN